MCQRTFLNRGAIGQQDGDAIDDGVAAMATVAAEEVCRQHETLPADRTRKPSEILLLEGRLVGQGGHILKVYRFRQMGGGRFRVARYHGKRDEQ